MHTLELASPAVATWSKPIILYSVVPDENDDDVHVKELNLRTQEAASNVMQNPALNGKTVVMVWEHKHIANEKLEAKFEGQAVTLRKLLKLDILPGVPKTWPGDNYDYFWIVDFPTNSNVPSRFTMVKQEFGAPFASVPSNDWTRRTGSMLRAAARSRATTRRRLRPARHWRRHPCGAGPRSGDAGQPRRA